MGPREVLLPGDREIFGLPAPDPPIKSEPSDQNILYPALPVLEDDEGPPPPTIQAKDTLTLELLPYMTRIFAARRDDTSTLEKITKFKPTSYLSTGEEGLEEDDDANLVTSRIGPSNGFGRPANTGVGAVAGRSAVPKMDAPSMEVEKLYIEEDDIEDD